MALASARSPIRHPIGAVLAIQGFTVADLALATGVSREHLSRVLHGSTPLTPGMRSRIALVLGAAESDLFQED